MRFPLVCDNSPPTCEAQVALCFNARQYSIVKDLDCFSNQQNRLALQIADLRERTQFWVEPL
jgi:hypothetical protein